MTEDNWKLLVENGVIDRYERKFRVEIDNRLMSTDDKRLIVSGHEKAVNEVIRLLQRPVDEAQLADVYRKPTVTISDETWKLLDQHGALKGFGKGLRVDVTARRISTGQWELTLSGPKRAVDKLCGWLQHPPRKLELSEAVSAWLVGQGPVGARIGVIIKRANVDIQFSPDKRSALLTGSSSEIDAAVEMISDRVQKKFDTQLTLGPYVEGDCTQMRDLTVVAERRENLEGVFAHLDELHKECFEVKMATARWLVNKRKGAEVVRARELDDEFDSFLDFSSDPGTDVNGTVGVEILGENADGVRPYRRIIGK